MDSRDENKGEKKKNKTMRVLIVNTSEQTGGAAIAASRLAEAMKRHGIKVQQVVRRRRWAFLWERLCIWLSNGCTRKGLWAVDIANAGTDITRLPAFKSADVIHLHWVNQGFLSMRQIERILRSGKPVVWTLHDMWPVTGVCHHACDCTRYQHHCHDCPQLQRPAAHDLSWRVFQQKLHAYSQTPLTFVAVSEWMAERARLSQLTAGHEVKVIPNTLPLNDFQRTDRTSARESLGLSADAQVVAFGAARIDQPIKGLHRLFAALRRLSATPADTGQAPLHLLLFGGCKDPSLLRDAPCPVTYVGEVAGPQALSRIYSAADVLVNSSDYETFGQTLIEAMACGCTPVSFDQGGQTDIIHHRTDGYLARFGDSEDLANGIRWALQTKLPPEVLRESVARRYAEEVVAQAHARLYEASLEDLRREEEKKRKNEVKR